MGSILNLIGLSRASLFVKIATLIACITAATSFTVSTLESRISENLTRDMLNEFSEKSTADIAQSLQRAIRFNDHGEIEAQVADFLEFAGARVETIVVLGPEGDIRHQGGGQGLESGDLVQFAAAAQDSSKQKIDELRFMNAEPVQNDAKDSRFGAVGVIWSAEAGLAYVRTQKIKSYAISLVVFLIMLIVAGYVVQIVITKPIFKLKESFDKIGGGQYDNLVPLLERTDELGEFGRNLNSLQVKLKETQALQAARDIEQEEQKRVVHTLRNALTELSKRNLTHTIDAKFSDEYEALREDYNKSVFELRDALVAVQSNIFTVRASTEEISSSSGDLARRTESQAATLEETSRTLAKINSAVSEAADNAQKVDKIVLETLQKTDENNALVRDAVQAMSEIENSSEKISSIISVIDDIAFQTNLLALNAGVEAARAGNAGRGFAVVATEVRSLAQRSADAAKEIKELITGSADQVERGVTLVRRTGDALSEISEQVSHVSGLVSGIASSSMDQAAGINEISTGVTELEAVTQENAAMVEESTAAGHLLQQQSAELAGLINQFNVDSKAVKDNIAA